MNEYQDALDRIKSINLDKVLDTCGYEVADEISDYGIHDHPNLEMSGDIDTLQRLIDKGIPKKPIKSNQHVWIPNENGDTDEYAWYAGACNGVVCGLCGKSVCVHCHADYNDLEDCEDHYLCPVCGKLLGVGCCCDNNECRQAIDWSELG